MKNAPFPAVPSTAAGASTSDALTRICADKQAHIERMKAQTPLAALQSMVQDARPTRGFIKALSDRPRALIAEVKKASPSKGLIRPDFDPVAIARIYEQSGAACLSVLTDTPYFQGSDEDFRRVRASVALPMLRKDFMLDPYQVYEARALGADCILLIMAALNDSQAAELYALATELGMDSLFEVHDEAELNRALALSPRMVGVNNRNLKTLGVSLETGLSLAHAIPENVVRVAESGLSEPAQLAAFEAAGFNAFLIGEHFMRQPDIGAAVEKILVKD